MSEQRTTLHEGIHNRGYLPHLKAVGGTYFVTFRLAGTLPGNVLAQYQAERDEIVKRANVMKRPLSKEEYKRLRELHPARIETYLDAGHDSCWLKRPDIAVLVVKALRFFDGRRYVLHPWVVMPNHVQVVLTPIGGHSLSSILHSWKSYMATEANKLVGRTGEPFWQRESYDHLVRDDEDFFRACEYTVNNPVIARLCQKPEDWEYSSAHV